MWIVNFLPTWLFYVLVIAGTVGAIASYFLAMIPLIGSNAKIIRIASVIAILMGVWLCGGAYNNSAWEARVKEMEAKVAAAEAESKDQNNKIADKAASRIEAIQSRKKDAVQYIEREVVKYDTQCVIPKEFILIHNKAAEQVK